MVVVGVVVVGKVGGVREGECGGEGVGVWYSLGGEDSKSF